MVKTKAPPVIGDAYLISSNVWDYLVTVIPVMVVAIIVIGVIGA